MCGGLTFECQVHIHTKLGSCTAAEKANLATVHWEKRGKFQMFLDPVSVHVRTILSEVRSAIAVTRSETPDLISTRSLLGTLQDNSLTVICQEFLCKLEKQHQHAALCQC